MKAGIYDPYLDTLGGGEKYCLSLVELLLKKNWVVDFFWDGEDLRKRIKNRFQADSRKINFVHIPQGLPAKFLVFRNYDLLFYVSDGSIPTLFSRKNILHLQVPFKKVNGRSIGNKIKFFFINKVVCNSEFTKKIVDEEFGIDGEVIYPPVEIDKFRPGKKENLIISVGRFSKLLQAKRQDILIESFKRLIDNGLKNWRLVLAGGSEIGGEDFVKELQKKIGAYPIEIKENISFKELVGLYSKAKIFWAANGYGVDENLNPEKVEHFGIAVAEAMAAGVIPIVTKKGGFKEIIDEGKNGFFWEKTEQLIKITEQLCRKKLDIIQKEAQKKSQKFSKEVFNEKFKKIIF